VIFDGERRALKSSIDGLRDEIAGLRRERDAAKKEVELTDHVIRLKTEIEDLRISKGRLTEEHEREKRELKHMIGLEKRRQEFEIDEATRAAKLTVREENLSADRTRFEEQMKFTHERFEKEVAYLKDLMTDILERLPTVTVDKYVGNGRRPKVEA
jgi:hypothetical protein